MAQCLIKSCFPIVVLGPVWCEVYEVGPFIFMLLAVLVNTSVVCTSDQVTGNVVREPFILSCDMFKSLRGNEQIKPVSLGRDKQ